jgi:hypothetical protein
MTKSDKPDPRGFKPGANMPDGSYDPASQGMSESGNHAVGNPGNDTPYGEQRNQQHQQQELAREKQGPASTEHNLRQDNQNRSDERNQQSAHDAATAATHRDKNAGARADHYTDTSRKPNS